MDVLALLRRSLADRYDVDRQIGAGGMALVFRARDRKHERWVAIKVLQPELAASIGTQRFLREIQFAAGLQHPNLLPVFDSGEAEGQLFYVMPFFEGESLAARLAGQGPLPLTDVLSIARDVASALTFAHQRGVIHRDIKPDNILLAGSRAVVADLGIARALDQAAHGGLTATGVAIGTAHYMSPEQALGDESAGAASDQYSLGCVVFEMLTGDQPFRAPSLPAVLAKVISAPRPRPSASRPDVPAGIDAAVMRSLAADPAERYASCDEFAAALDAAPRGALTGTVSTAPVTAHRTRIAAAAVTLLALGAGAYVMRRPHESAPATPVRVPAQGARIAILPFTTTAASNAVLGDGMVDLVAANLSDIDGVSIVPARLLLQRVGGDTARDAASTAARELGATAVVSGSLIGLGTRARLVALVSRTDGSELARVQFEGADTAALALIDSLSVAVLRSVWDKERSVPTGRDGALTTSSLPAVRAYLVGEQAARRGEWTLAAEQFGNAIAKDSTFALAYAALANAFGWTDSHGTPAALHMFELGARYANRLPARDHRFFDAARAFSLGRVASVDSAVAFVASYPDDLDGWLLLGETRFHSRALVAATPAELFAPFDTLVRRDPNYVPAYVHPMELATELGDVPLLTRYVDAYANRAPAALAARSRRILRAVTGSPDTLARVLETIAADRGAQTLLVALLAAPSRRSPQHQRAALDALRTSVESVRMDQGALANRAYVLARYLAGVARRDTAAVVLADLQHMRQADNATFATALAVSIADPSATRFGQVADSMLATIRTASALVALMRAERAWTLGDTTRAAALVAPLVRDTTVSADVAGQVQALLGAIRVIAGDSTGGLRELDAGLTRSGFRTYALTSAPMRYARAATLMARSRGLDARGRALLTTGFTDDLEYIAPVRRLLQLPGEAAWRQSITSGATR